MNRILYRLYHTIIYIVLIICYYNLIILIKNEKQINQRNRHVFIYKIILVCYIILLSSHIYELFYNK
jgi:hypothetical protein